MASAQSSAFKRSADNFVSAITKLQLVLNDKKLAENVPCRSLANLQLDMSNEAAVEVLARCVEDSIEDYIRHRIHTRQRVKDRRTIKIKTIVQGWIRDSYPFVNLFLTIAKYGSSVSLAKFAC